MRRDFDQFTKGGEKSSRLQKLEEALLSIPPTSVEAERAFSSAALFCTKIRSSLGDEALDDLCYTKAHLLSAMNS